MRTIVLLLSAALIAFAQSKEIVAPAPEPMLKVVVSLMQQPVQHVATLVWNDTLNSAAATYSVYRAPGLCSGSPTFNKIATAVAEKTYRDATVTPGNYCYQVTATDFSVESPPSNTAQASVPSFAPTNLSIGVV